jgi:hypothetical protein
MKKYLLFLLPALLLSCGQSTQEKTDEKVVAMSDSIKKSDNTLQALIDANIHNQPQIDSACLGFTFGMTKEQAITHFNQLVKEKKLVMDDQDHRYEYPMTFELVKAKAVIAPEFQGNKLFRVSLVIMPVHETANAETVYLQASVAYMKKYSDYKLFQEPDVLNDKDKQFHWIKNNLQIHLHQNIDGTVAEYTDMLMAKGLNNENKAATDSSKAQTSKDI